MEKGGEGPPKEGPDDPEFTLWIDSKTLLPVKRVFNMKRGDGVRITEIYTEFKLDPKVDGKAFELPR